MSFPRAASIGIKAAGLDAFRKRVVFMSPFLTDRVDELKSFDDIKLLSVAVDRLRQWWRPGLICIGDAAHAMSPIGGVGVNLAVQDAVAAANRLAAPLKAGTASDDDLRAIQARRTFPVRFTQALQLIMQKRIISPALASTQRPKPPLALQAGRCAAAASAHTGPAPCRRGAAGARAHPRHAGRALRHLRGLTARRVLAISAGEFEHEFAPTNRVKEIAGIAAMSVAEESLSANSESRPFEADVAKLLQLMVHSVYSEKSVFLRELISNAADACERLRYEAIAAPALLGDDPKPRITITVDAEHRQLMIEDNGIGMSREELIEALGTIARSGTKAFIDRLEAAKDEEETALIGRFGVGFYSAFMVAEQGRGRFRAAPAATRRMSGRRTARARSRWRRARRPTRRAAARAWCCICMEDAKSYTERATVERLVRAQSGHVPVPIAIVEKPGAELAEITDGAALWAKPKSSITPADYTDFYRSIAGQFDEPALTIHFHAEGRHDYTSLLFVPGARPFDLFDPDRKGRIKLYVKRVFITDDADILPRYLRFVRGLVDSRRSAAQRLARENPGKPAPCRHPQGRHQPRARRIGTARRQGAGQLQKDLGAVRRRPQGGRVRGFRAPRCAARAGAL